MVTSKCILERRSIRAFRPDKLPQRTLEELIGLARFSPSWANSKTARYTCISDDARREQAVKCCQYNAKIVRSAPPLIVLSAVTDRSGAGSPVHTSWEWTMFDAGLAAQTLCLAAWDMGIGSIILGAFDPAIAQVAELPEGERVAALIALGWPDETPAAPRRKEVADILRIL